MSVKTLGTFFQPLHNNYQSVWSGGKFTGKMSFTPKTHSYTPAWSNGQFTGKISFTPKDLQNQHDTFNSSITTPGGKHGTGGKHGPGTENLVTQPPQSTQPPPGQQVPPSGQPVPPSGQQSPPVSGSSQYGGSTVGTLPPALQNYAKYFNQASSETGIPANVLAAQAWQESRGNITAGSINGGTGLTDSGMMQMDPATLQALKQEYPQLNQYDMNTAQGQIMAAAYYDKDMHKKFGNIPDMLRAYNSGPNGVSPGNPNATPSGTGDPTYVSKVLQFAQDIQNGTPLPA